MRTKSPPEAVHVLGAGGIGVALAWALARSGSAVTVVEADPRKVAFGHDNGLEVEGHGRVRPAFLHFDEWEPDQSAWTFLCVKTYDNPRALARVPANVRMLPVQNGFDPELDQRNHAAEGIASFVSECERDRPITKITRPGSLHIGPRRAVTPEEQDELRALVEKLNSAGLFQALYVPDIRPFKAAKLMYNAAISPLAAAAGVDNGELLSDPVAKRMFFALLQENYAIFRHAEISLARIGPFHPDSVSRILKTPFLPSLMAMFFRPSLRGTYCSMAPDINTGKTEIEAYNGHLIRLAGDFPCPINRAAFALIKDIVAGKAVPQRAHLQTLAGALNERAVSW